MEGQLARRGGGQNSVKAMVERDCDNLFYHDVDLLLNYQVMSSPQSSPSQLDPFLTSGVHSLNAPFSSLFIDSYRDKEVHSQIKSRQDTKGKGNFYSTMYHFILRSPPP